MRKQHLAKSQQQSSAFNSGKDSNRPNNIRHEGVVVPLSEQADVDQFASVSQ